MIWNAKSLQRTVKEMERDGSEASPADPLLFQGTILAGAILLSLATEIVLPIGLFRELPRIGRPHGSAGLGMR